MKQNENQIITLLIRILINADGEGERETSHSYIQYIVVSSVLCWLVIDVSFVKVMTIDDENSWECFR